tara:strand:- start:50 stop:229 length:180 start_codon:yes stop_codon:yes gene_type:complete
MNVKRKKEIEKYYLQINKACRDLKYMKYDHELDSQEEMKVALVNLEKIRLELKNKLENK